MQVNGLTKPKGEMKVTGARGSCNNGSPVRLGPIPDRLPPAFPQTATSGVRHFPPSLDVVCGGGRQGDGRSLISPHGRGGRRPGTCQDAAGCPSPEAGRR